MPLITLIAALCTTLFAIAEPSTAPSSAGVPRLALAFYYPWYGTPTGDGGKQAGGKFIHWTSIDEPNHLIGDSRHYPNDGPYDSFDPSVIRRHVQLARNAGIDGFIASWWGKDSYEDKAFARLLDVCEPTDLKLSIYIEDLTIGQTGVQPPTASSTETLFRDILTRFAPRPAYLRVSDRPVIFIYGRALGQLKTSEWSKVVEALAKDSSPPLLIADSFDAKRAAPFDGMHDYGPAGALVREKDHTTPEAMKAWAKRSADWWVARAREDHKIACVTVFPGYDDTKIRRPGILIPRNDGSFFRDQLDIASKSGADWILITSFNEWHEGSEIEPSIENGGRELETLRIGAAAFKAQPPKSK